MSGTTGLPREVLKWLQSLDLSYSVKNVRRDFANGFLVAEIFSRYYASDVTMHSYDNGISIQRKLGNWELLCKFFDKHDIKLDKALIHDVVHCKSQQAPAALVSSIYTLLTGRQVKPAKLPAVDIAASGTDAANGADAPPAYMKPNAAAAVNSRIKESELSSSLADQQTATARTKEVLDEHAAKLRSDRLAEPARYATSSGYGAQAMQRELRGAPKQMSQQSDSLNVRFQEVKVKEVDRNIAHLRAGASQQQSTTSLHGAPRGPADLGLPPPAPSGLAPASADVMSVLAQPLAAAGYTGGSPNEALSAFVADLPALSAAQAGAFFGAAAEVAPALAEACMADPRQCWHLFHFGTSALSAAEPADLFERVARLLCAVGEEAVCADSVAAQSLLVDWGLPRLLPLLRATAAHQLPLLAVMYAWTADSPDAHMATIKALQEALADQATFVRALTGLVTLEAEFSDTLLDLCAPPPAASHLRPPPAAAARPCTRAPNHAARARAATSTTRSSHSVCPRPACVPPPSPCSSP